MNNPWLWFWVVIALGVVVGAFLIVRRRRYVGKVRALGWTLEPNPSLTCVADLNAPPFGLGLSRSVDELVSGTTAAGHAFRVLEYDYSGAGHGYSERVACLQLAFGLPDVFVSDGDQARPGISPAGVSLVQAQDGALRAIAADGPLAAQVLALVGPGVAAFSLLADQVDLGIDGDQLVVSHAPKDPDDLLAFLAALDPIVAALFARSCAAMRWRPRRSGSGSTAMRTGGSPRTVRGSSTTTQSPLVVTVTGSPTRSRACGTASGWTRSPTSGRPIAPRPTPTPRATCAPGR